RAHPIHAAATSSTLSLDSPRHLQDLHAFPTRRSSDLEGITKGRVHIALAPGEHEVGLTVNEYETLLMRHDLADALRDRGASTARSEEHTSELQSPYDLVCRLLLEKKKDTNSPTRCATR